MYSINPGLDRKLNSLNFCSCFPQANSPGPAGSITGSLLAEDIVIGYVIPGLWTEPPYLLLSSRLPGGRPSPAVDQ